MTVEERLWKRVDRRGEDDCWNWQGQVDRDGYGLIKVEGQKRRVHRIVLESVTGQAPNVVMHTCDNPRCCNPKHLRNGTYRENQRDKVRKDRQAKGGRNGRAVLNDQLVRSIRQRHAQGEAGVVLAKELGVDRTTVRDLLNRKTWRHLN